MRRKLQINLPKNCSQCGTLLIERFFEEREREFCPQCQRIEFRSLKVGAGGVIEKEGKLLLLRRNHVPFNGDWNLPSGYVENDEHLMWSSKNRHKVKQLRFS